MQSATDTPRAPLSHLNLPFFEAQHRSLAEQLRDWVPRQSVDESDDAAMRQWTRLLGQAGWLRYCVSRPGSLVARWISLDSRALVILRRR